MALPQLDIHTLADCRRVNKLAREAVDNLALYKQIVKHAPNVLKGCVSSQSGSSVLYFAC